MSPDSPKLLEDIRDAGSFVLKITKSLNESSYPQNRLVRQAVERNFEIIGEALNRLSKVDETTVLQLGDIRRIIGFRNILAHAYDDVDHDVVWAIIQYHLPDLVDKVTKLLSRHSGNDIEEYHTL